MFLLSHYTWYRFRHIAFFFIIGWKEQQPPKATEKLKDGKVVYRSLSPEDAWAKLNSTRGIVLADVRTEKEYEEFLYQLDKLPSLINMYNLTNEDLLAYYNEVIIPMKYSEEILLDDNFDEEESFEDVSELLEASMIFDNSTILEIKKITYIIKIKENMICYRNDNGNTDFIELESCANNYESTHNIMNKNELKVHCVGERLFGEYAYYEIYTEDEHTQIYMMLKSNVIKRFIFAEIVFGFGVDDIHNLFG